jgi:hypothetical protein
MKYLLFCILLISNLFAEHASLEREAIQNLKQAYSVGKKFKLPGGDDLALTLASMYYRETSLGMNKVFNFSVKYYVLDGNKKTYITYKKFFDPSKKQNVTIKGKTYIVNREIIYNDSSTGQMEMKVSTAKEVILNTPELKKYRPLVNNRALMLKLLHDKETSFTIAGYYIMRCYNESVERFGPGANNLAIAVQRYNGGWSNPKYLMKFRQDREVVQKLVKLYRIDTAV